MLGNGRENNELNGQKNNERSQRQRAHGARCVRMRAPALAHLRKATYHAEWTPGRPAPACRTRPTRSCCGSGVRGAVPCLPVAFLEGGAQGPSEGASKKATGCTNGWRCCWGAGVDHRTEVMVAEANGFVSRSPWRTILSCWQEWWRNLLMFWRERQGYPASA